MISHFPVLAGVVDPDVTKTNKADTGTEIEVNKIAGTFGGPRSRLYKKPTNGGREPGSRLTRFPAIAGILETDFTKKPIKAGMVPISRLTLFPVLSGILDPDCAKF